MDREAADKFLMLVAGVSLAVYFLTKAEDERAAGNRTAAVLWRINAAVCIAVPAVIMFFA